MVMMSQFASPRKKPKAKSVFFSTPKRSKMAGDSQPAGKTHVNIHHSFKVQRQSFREVLLTGHRHLLQFVFQVDDGNPEVPSHSKEKVTTINLSQMETNVVNKRKHMETGIKLQEKAQV